MKTPLKIAAILVGVLLISGVVFLFVIPSADDLCPERGGGNTEINGQVLDLFTGKVIDSVRLTIRYGMSGDRLIDTMLLQQDSVRYNFKIPENDCEYYWFEISNRYYCQYDSTASIDKGKVNYFTTRLTPATVVHLTMERSINNTSDTVFLELTNPDKDDKAYWSTYSNLDFYPDTTYLIFGDPAAMYSEVDGKRKLSTHFNLASGVDYQGQWIRHHDTLIFQLKSNPFDTVHLDYRFK